MDFLVSLQTQALAPLIAVILVMLGALVVMLALRAEARREHRTEEPVPWYRRFEHRSADREVRIELASRRLADLLAGQVSASAAELRHRFELANQGPVQSHFLDGPADVAEGMLLLGRVVPEAALHDGNVLLLSKLRALIGSADFLYACDLIAEQAGEPRHAALREGLRQGSLHWNEFLVLVRCMDLSGIAGLYQGLPDWSRQFVSDHYQTIEQAVGVL